MCVTQNITFSYYVWCVGDVSLIIIANYNILIDIAYLHRQLYVYYDLGVLINRF